MFNARDTLSPREPPHKTRSTSFSRPSSCAPRGSHQSLTHYYWRCRHVLRQLEVELNLVVYNSLFPMCSKKHKLSHRTVPHSSCRDCIQRTHNPSLPWKLSSFIKLQTKVSARTVKLFFTAKKGISIENWHRRAPSGVESTQNGRCTLQVLASYKGIKTNHKYPLSRADFHNCVKNRRRPWTAVGLHKSYLGQN